MTIERPMFPPRADSVDSFFPQPAIRRPAAKTAAGDSPKPVQGMSRRLAIAGLAMLPVALPVAVPARPDPAFALIDAKLAADVAQGVLLDELDRTERDHGVNSDPAEEAYDRCGAACVAVNAADYRLASTPPTTLAGVAAVLRFANQIEDAGLEWPDTDTIGAEGWHYQLRATMAAAIESIITAHAGKAVLS
jgi:hypothetical protein